MSTTAAQLSRVIGPLRRAVLRGTRTSGDLPDLPDAQIEALRVLVDAESASPGELAVRLRLARSTVSNLIRAMLTAGLVERTEGPDLRSVRLSASPRATGLLTRYDEAGEQMLDEAFSELDPADLEAISAALPALGRLTATVDAMSVKRG